MTSFMESMSRVAEVNGLMMVDFVTPKELAHLFVVAPSIVSALLLPRSVIAWPNSCNAGGNTMFVVLQGIPLESGKLSGL